MKRQFSQGFTRSFNIAALNFLQQHIHLTMFFRKPNTRKKPEKKEKKKR